MYVYEHTYVYIKKTITVIHTCLRKNVIEENSCHDLTYDLVLYSYTNGETDRQTDRQKAYTCYVFISTRLCSQVYVQYCINSQAEI